jgi:hypothetical protein
MIVVIETEMRFAAVLGLAVVVVASGASARAPTPQESGARAAKTARAPVRAHIRVRGPQVVLFAPSRWCSDAPTDHASEELLAHVRFAVDDLNRCKGDAKIGVRIICADTLTVEFEGRRNTFNLSRKDLQEEAGAYLFKSGRRPCAIRGMPGALGDLVSAGVAEFFGVPACVQEGMSDVCREGAG